jgi:hypothetical protein
MPVPTAIVTVRVLSLEALPAATPSAGVIRYARATIRGGSAPVLETGRTQPIPDGAGSFAVPWMGAADIQTIPEAGIADFTKNLCVVYTVNSALATYALATSIGPLAGTNWLFQFRQRCYLPYQRGQSLF